MKHDQWQYWNYADFGHSFSKKNVPKIKKKEKKKEKTVVTHIKKAASTILKTLVIYALWYRIR